MRRHIHTRTHIQYKTFLHTSRRHLSHTSIYGIYIHSRPLGVCWLAVASDPSGTLLPCGGQTHQPWRPLPGRYSLQPRTNPNKSLMLRSTPQVIPVCTYYVPLQWKKGNIFSPDSQTAVPQPSLGKVTQPLCTLPYKSKPFPMKSPLIQQEAQIPKSIGRQLHCYHIRTSYKVKHVGLSSVQ